MYDVKSPTSYDQQIEKLISRGCLIDDKPLCESVLSQIGYYRLSAYFLPFCMDDKYTKGLRFERVYHIYEFDRKLRHLIYGAIEVIEVNLRATLSYFHSIKYGSLGYLDPGTFNPKHNSKRFQENIDREIENNNKVPFVQHHIKSTMVNFRFGLPANYSLSECGHISMATLPPQIRNNLQVQNTGI